LYQLFDAVSHGKLIERAQKPPQNSNRPVPKLGMLDSVILTPLRLLISGLALQTHWLAVQFEQFGAKKGDTF
jgi:hypothetical protein